MPSLTSYRIAHGEYEYELDLDFKDEAIMRNAVEFDIVARRRPRTGGEWEQVTVTISFSFEEERAYLSVSGEAIGEYKLAAIDLPADVLAEEAWAHVLKAYDGIPLEEAIHLIPTDPFFGCLIKAGISTTLGQAVRCYRETAEAAGTAIERIRATIRCLGDNLLGMLTTATIRTLRCMVLGGLG